jgi:ABC-type transporter Mla MlaB component
MSNPDEGQLGKLCVGEELTKVTIAQELSRAMEFFKRCGSSEQSITVCIDFIKLKRVDTLAVVFIVQIERFI